MSAASVSVVVTSGERHEVKERMVLFAGKTVWSMPERFVCTLCKKALYKYFSFPFLYCVASADLWLSSQLLSDSMHWLVWDYTAWWQCHMDVNNLPSVTVQPCPVQDWTHDLLIAGPVPSLLLPF